MSRRSLAVAFVLLAALGCRPQGGHGGSFSLVLASMASPGSMAPPASASAPQGAPAVPSPPSPAAQGVVLASTAQQPPAGVWLKGDFHVHSNHSGDATPYGDDVATVIALAERAGLDFTVISDHRNSDCLTDPQFLTATTPLVLIPGEEWGQPGHAGAHGLTGPLTEDTEDESQGPAVAIQKIQATIAQVHSMGGIFVLNHPIDDSVPWNWPVQGWDGLECWNQPWALRSTTPVTPRDILTWAQNHGMTQAGLAPPPENLLAAAFQGGGQNWQRLKLYEAYLNSGRHIAAMAGGDTHYLFLPGSPTTVVFAKDRTMKSILDGVRGRHTMVQRAPDAPELEFTADRDGDGVFESIVGDSIPIGVHPVTFKLHVRDDQDGKLVLVKNGTPVATWPVTSSDFTVTWTDNPSQASWYRVDCYEKLDMTMPGASDLRTAVLGTSQVPWLYQLLTGPLAGALGKWAADIQKVLDEGGPALLWLIIHGGQVGVKTTPVATTFPRFELPRNVSQFLNVAVHDTDYCMGVLTSPIWIE